LPTGPLELPIAAARRVDEDERTEKNQHDDRERVNM